MISRSFERPERTAKRANDTSNRYRTRHIGPQDAAHHAWSAHTTAFSGTHRLAEQYYRDFIDLAEPLHGTDQS